MRSLAAELDLRPTKQRGQNFVIDPNTVRRIVRDSGVESTDRVIEVGPGLGSLTLALLEAVDSVVAVEIDPLLAGRLAETVAEYAPSLADRLTVVPEDALRITSLPGEPPTALVANLPYNVSVPVLLHLLALLPSLERGLVMVQAEVADRLAAVPGSKVYGVPSVKAAWYADVRRAGSIGRNVFWPAPNVDSGLVAWTRREPPATTATRKQVFSVIDAAFAHRRKALRPSLRELFGSAEASTAALERAGIDPMARGEQLGIEEFARIAEGLADELTSPCGLRRRSTCTSASVRLVRTASTRWRPSTTRSRSATTSAPVGPTRGASRSPPSPMSTRPRFPSTATTSSTAPSRCSPTCTAYRSAGDLSIHKSIPVAGGMAGGSADAAAALVAFDRLWDLHTSDDDLLRLAADAR